MSWQSILRRNFTKWDQLADYLELSEAQRSQILQKAHFPLNLPLRLAQKIVKGTLNDPILQQFLPVRAETQTFCGYTTDPVGDVDARLSPKLIQKYQGRALLVCTSICAMHCRYCFRQNYEYDTSSGTAFKRELDLIRSDPTLHEILLSGGDPLSLSNRTLTHLLRELSAIPHVARIRFHTRFPIGIPERIDNGFLELLREIPQAIWFVIHSNHALELDDDVLVSLKKLRQQGVVLLNQSVLLKGVNDDVKTLKDLCEKLVDHGILPYNLNQLDLVQGAARFEVSEERGRQLIKTLSEQLPGYAIPRYVRELAGKPSKTVLL